MNRQIKYQAYWSNRVPQLGMCSVKALHFEEGRVEISNGAVRVFPKLEEVELLQFTGMVDDDGKEIYEGDILQKLYKCQDQGGKISVCDMTIFPVEYRTQTAGFNITTGKNHGYRVIGNIYQNPELLQK